MSGAWGKGSTRRWRKTRLDVLNRDKWTCQLRITGICKYKADCVHHLKGKQFGDDPAYLVASCTPCNLHIGDPTHTYRGRTTSTTPPPSTRTATTPHQPRDPPPKPTTLW